VNCPAELKYTKEHEWLRIDGDSAVVGITDYAQGELGDIVFVELPSVGGEIKAGEAFGTIEAVKAVSDMYAPVSGKILEVNEALEDDPMVINRDPYSEGWMVKVRISNSSELNALMDAAAYESLIGA